jgi:DHA1 family bicyclomycin/chloramphenicol resistance-like MFS transporter
LFAALLCLACHYRLAESLPASKRQPFSVRPLLANYFKLFGSVRFGLLSSALALNFSAFFLYIASAPAVIYGLLGMGEKEFAWLFVPGISGVIMGAFLSGRLAGKLSPRRTVRYGYSIMTVAALFNLAYHLTNPPALLWTVLPVMAYTVGMSLAMPSITLLVLDLFPDNRGLAASLQAAQQSFFTGLASGLLSPYVSGTGLGLAVGMAALLSSGLACWYIFIHLPKKEAGT